VPAVVSQTVSPGYGVFIHERRVFRTH